MSSSEPPAYSNKLNNVINKNSKITPIEKIIIGILLVVIFIIVISILRKTMEVPASHNSLIADGVRRYLAIIPFVGFKSDMYAVNADGSEEIISTTLPENLGVNPDWSDDGKWIVYQDWEYNSDGFGNALIYIRESDDGQKILVPVSGGGYEPTWSPDGKQIAYKGYAPFGAGIYIVDIECLLHGESCTPSEHLLVEQNGPSEISSPDWSPNGKQILYEKYEEYQEFSHFSIINVDGHSQAIDLIPPFAGSFYEPKWSPDGTKIVGVCSNRVEFPLPNIPNICLINRDGSNFSQLTNYTINTDLSHPIWFPNGQKIAYLSNFSVPSMEGACWDACPRTNAVFSINIDGTGETRLFSEKNFAIRWLTWYP